VLLGLLLLALSFCSALCAAASADTWCVTPATGCDASHTKATVAAALAATASNPGADTIKLGPKSYAENDLTATDPDPLTIIGAGADKTVLKRESSSGGLTTLHLDGAGAVQISGLKLYVYEPGDTGLLVDAGGGGTVTDVEIDGADQTTPVSLGSAGGTWQLSKMLFSAISGAPAECVDAGEASVVVTDSTFSGCNIAIHGAVFAYRVSISGQIGIDVGNGTALLDDSLVSASNTAVDLGASLGSGTVGLVADQDTLVGTVPGATGVKCFNTVGGTGQLTIRDTIVRSFDTSMEVDNAPGHPCSIAGSFDDYDFSKTSTTGGGSGTISISDGLNNVDPQFIDPTHSDYRLQSTSTLRALDSRPLGLLESATDLIGTLRIINGERDLGAYERPAGAKASTSAAKAITTSTATLKGTGNTEGALGSATFVYGLTQQYGSRTSVTSLSATLSSTSLGAILRHLVPGRTYHYALVVTTAYGMVRSTDATFKTASPFGKLTTAHIQARKRSVAIELHCSGAAGAACTGNAVLRSAGKIVGRKSFKLKAGQSLKLTVALNTLGKSLLKRSHQLSVVLTVSVSGPHGAHVVKRASVTLVR
jgi:hypothetical protein